MPVEAKFGVGTGGRFIGARLLPGTDLVEGLKELCRQAGIKSGAIVSCPASLAQATFVYLVPREKPDNPNDPMQVMQAKLGFGFSPVVKLPGPLELAAVEGTIGYTEGSDELFIHIHAQLVDQFGKVHGGHLLDSGTTVLATADVIIAEIDGVQMVRKPDPQSGAISLQPTAVQKTAAGA